VLAPWCARPECEQEIKVATGATSRVIIDDAGDAACVNCGLPTKAKAFFARSY
jgi:hypothetical protein